MGPRVCENAFSLLCGHPRPLSASAAAAPVPSPPPLPSSILTLRWLFFSPIGSTPSAQPRSSYEAPLPLLEPHYIFHSDLGNVRHQEERAAQRPAGQSRRDARLRQEPGGVQRKRCQRQRQHRRRFFAALLHRRLRVHSNPSAPDVYMDVLVRLPAPSIRGLLDPALLCLGWIFWVGMFMIDHEQI